MERPLVSAVVLNYRTAKAAIPAVRSLLRQSIGDRVEVLLVDNHSDDDSVGLLRNTFRAEPRVRMVETNVNRGYGQGNETAVRLANGEFLLIINPDNELEPEGLEKMIAVLEAEKDIGILGPKLVFEDGSVRDSYRTFPRMSDVFIKRTFLRALFPQRMRRYLQHDANPDETRDVDWLAGACLLMRTSFYRELGGFDPQFFLFFEDTDLCRRCWRAGKRVVYCPSVLATDRKHRLSEGGFLTLLTKWTVRTHLKSALKYFWKWRGQGVW